MSWVTPKTWVLDEVVDETDLNTHVRDNLRALYPDYATSLPGSPYNDKQAILTDSTTAPTWRWHVRYNSTLAKWEYIGGTELVGPSTNLSHANSSSYQFSGATAVAVPVSGVYDTIVASTYGTCAGAGRAMYTVAVNSAADDSYATGVYGTLHPALYAVNRRTLTGGAVLSIGYRVIDGSVSFTQYGIHVRLRPVTLG